jgi:tRNA (adenine57-N1/adenine58-N1)-methyltransferase
MQSTMMSDNIIKEGDNVLLYTSKGKTWLVKAEVGAKVHTHLGIIELSNIIGKEFGEVFETTLSAKIVALKPYLVDYLMKSARNTQIVYPKDIGFIIMETGLCPGSIVVEAGTGSGVLTTAIASHVRPNGHIYTYEVRDEFIEIAEKNLIKAGVRDYVTIKNKDASLMFDEKNVDIAIIDVGDPWKLAKPAYDSLKGGGAISAVLPTMNQAEKLASELRNLGFIDIYTVELMLRNLEAREGMTRPSTRMIAHTAYLMFARKAIFNK